MKFPIGIIRLRNTIILGCGPQLAKMAPLIEEARKRIHELWDRI
ncbi:MAG: hypothetical protein ACFFCS_28810 [Candidatus Hodarchaeota archaeon]